MVKYIKVIKTFKSFKYRKLYKSLIQRFIDIKEVLFMLLRKKRKASLQISINAIVVLVMAMLVLGLGIGFIKGFFNKGTETLGGAFDVVEFGLDPTSAEPLVLSQGDISIKRSSTKEVNVGFYNTGEPTSLKIGIISCIDTSEDQVTPLVSSLEQTVETGGTAGYKIFLTAKKNAETGMDPGSYICTLAAYPSSDPAPTYENAVANTQITMIVTG
jgi:hypothetical protein